MVHNYIVLIFSFLLQLLLFSCTSVNQVRTVGKGNIGMEITVGGPLITNLDAPIPSPNFFIGPCYGLLNDLDITALVNITAPITPGLLDLITGINWVPVQPGIRNQKTSPEKGFGVRGSFTLQWITDFKHGIVIFPGVETAGGWRYHWFNPFLGMTLGLNLYRYHDTEPTAVINPFLGIEFIRHITVPCLHMHGSLDRRVLIQQAYNYYNVLKSRTNYTHYIGKSRKLHEEWIAKSKHRNIPFHSFSAEKQITDYWNDSNNPSHCCVNPDELDEPQFSQFLGSIGRTTGEEIKVSSKKYEDLVTTWVKSIIP